MSLFSHAVASNCWPIKRCLSIYENTETVSPQNDMTPSVKGKTIVTCPRKDFTIGCLLAGTENESSDWSTELGQLTHRGVLRRAGIFAITPV